MSSQNIFFVLHKSRITATNIINTPQIVYLVKNNLKNENTQLSWNEKHDMMKQKATFIFTKYCTNKERKMSRPNALSWGSEGSYIYDPNEEKVIDIQETRKNKFTVITQNDNKYLQYTIIKKENKYLIDSKKRKFLRDDKWSVDYL